MKIKDKNYQTIWIKKGDSKTVQVIDQRMLPFKFEIIELHSVEDAFFAIREMVVRGAPLIGITAAYGMYLALLKYKNNGLENYLLKQAEYLKSSRPTAVNLAFVTDEMLRFILNEKESTDLVKKTLQKANQLKEMEIDFSMNIGKFGEQIIKDIYTRKRETVNILTHCNAGWLACIDWGTATAPIYKAHQSGIPVHVWVDETRPRNQGARITAFELGEEGIPHTIIPDNTGGHLMQHKMVDLVLVGSDRTTLNGDVANKIGTYLKALAAYDINVPIYVALSSSSFDVNLENGLAEIPIEQRNPEEVSEVEGWDGNSIKKVRVTPENSAVANFGFDVTPARLITGLITENGICKPNKQSIVKLFPKYKRV